jgi:DNA replication protein DnaC
LQARLKVLTHPALLAVDEIGYLPISRAGAMLFFQLMTRRYEQASTVLTSNKKFEEWARSSATMSGRGAHRSPRPPLPPRHHPRQQLPDATA